MLSALNTLAQRARQQRWLHLVVVNLRFLIGFAFMPSGLKKVLGQPFTDPDKVGPFNDFLHAFHATGGFYRVVGVVQLTAAILLLTQRFATLGALMAVPILTAIVALCWSTAVYPTAVVVTLMSVATLGLLVWDIDKWRSVFRADRESVEPSPVATDSGVTAVLIEMGLWRGCGVAILVLYFAVCVLSGGVYRPRGVEFDQPAFYLLPAIALMPVVTWLIERWRRRRARRDRAPGA
ncbi:hypothetical protein [Haliangium sp.]|uniref:hypothetical protein n=1 Tax=Haliangium sp. TaxID=2663208 RepID=UPI003D0E56F6